MANLKVNAETRELGVKNVFRKSMQENYITCVIYGGGKDNRPIKVNRKDFNLLYKKAKSNTVFDMTLNGATETVFIKDVSHALTSTEDIIHVDFLSINPKSEIRVLVPFETKGTPEGLKMGGHVETYIRSVWIECLGGEIPDVITHDISPMNVGERLYIGDVQKLQKFKLIGASDSCLLAVMMSRKAASTQTKTE